jgi:uracil-DNA glycosylase family protein
MPKAVRPPAQSFFPARATHASFAGAVQACEACELYRRATRAVFGEGPMDADVMFVGEQPGDQEDLQGHPFVGPAGKFLRTAMTEAGIPPERVYLTNAVKHFNWVESVKGAVAGTGKIRRVHKPPNLAQINACRPWLEAERTLVKPRMIVCLGASAARSLLGPGFRVSRQRGEPIRSPGEPWMMATFHPSAIVRMPDRAKRDEARALFLKDLRKAAAQMRRLAG